MEDLQQMQQQMQQLAQHNAQVLAEIQTLRTRTENVEAAQQTGPSTTPHCSLSPTQYRLPLQRHLAVFRLPNTVFAAILLWCGWHFTELPYGFGVLGPAPNCYTASV